MVDVSLKNMQHWMQTVLLSKGNLKEKLEIAKAKSGLDIQKMVKVINGVSKHKRLDVYASGYVLRLLECLKSEYPLLCDFMGESLFELFAKAHIVTLPSSSWSLQYLGKEFPLFLEQSKPKIDFEGEQKDRIEKPIALAYLERAKAEALTAPGLEEKPVDSAFYYLNHIFNVDIHAIELRTPACLQLLCSNYNVHTYALKTQNNAEQALKKETTFLAVSRMHYRLQITTLTEWQYEILELRDKKISIYEAFTMAAKKCNLNTKQMLTELMVWVNLAYEKGIIY